MKDPRSPVEPHSMIMTRCLTHLLLLLPLLSACHHNSPPADTVTVVIDKGPDNLDPRIGTNSESERIDQLLFNSLVKRGPRLEILPDLAYRWEAPDPITYRFYLRAG